MSNPSAGGGGVTHVDHSAVTDLANKMDELSDRAQSVLARYEDAVHHAQASGSFSGSAAVQNTITGGEVKEAQMKIQTRFRNVNDLLRSGASTYTQHDADNAHQIASVAGSMQFKYT